MDKRCTHTPVERALKWNDSNPREIEATVNQTEPFPEDKVVEPSIPVIAEEQKVLVSDESKTTESSNIKENTSFTEIQILFFLNQTCSNTIQVMNKDSNLT